MKEAGLKGEILATLGQSNMANLCPKSKTVVLCGDYDGDNHPRTQKNLIKIAKIYTDKDDKVHILYPATIGPQKLDFNDMLKTDGIQKIQELFKGLANDFKTTQENPNQDLQTPPSRGNPQDPAQGFASDREQSLSKDQAFQKTQDPIALETEASKDRTAAMLKDVEKTSSLREKVPPSFGQKEHEQISQENTFFPKKTEKFLNVLGQFESEQDPFKRKLFFKDMAYAFKEMDMASLCQIESQILFRDKMIAGIIEYKDHPALKGSCEKIQATLRHMDLFQEEKQKIIPISQENIRQEVQTLQEQWKRMHQSMDPLKKIEHLLEKLDSTSDSFKQKLINKDLKHAFSSLDAKALNTLESNPSLKDKIEKHAPHLIQKTTMVME